MKHARNQVSWPHVLAASLGVLLLFSGSALAQSGKGGGKPGGGGGGGGGSDPAPPTPADPAIAFHTGSSSGALVVMNADGSGLTSLVVSGASAPAWSPDLDGDPSNGYQGTVAFRYGPGNEKLWLLDVEVINGVAAGQRLRSIATQEGHYPDWSPDLDPDTPGYQGRLLWTGGYGIEYIDIEWNGDPVAPSTVTIGEPIVLVEPQDLDVWLEASWSPDGSRIAYLHMNLDIFNIVVTIGVFDDLTTLEPRALATFGGGITGPKWSRTGNHLAFSQSDVLHVLDVDDPENTFTSLGVGGQFPSWAPDDSALVFSASSGNTHKIFRYDFATANVALLAGDNKVHYRNPHWRPF